MSKPVRLPDYLAAEVQRLADAEKRSLANMVKVLLEQALRMDGSLSERDGVHGDEVKNPVTDGGAVHRRVPTPRTPVSRSESDLHFKPDFK